MSRAITCVVVALAVLCAPLFAVDPGQFLPTGMRITPLAAKGAMLETLNPGLAEFPNFVASMGVSSRVSPDGKTLLVVTAGYNQNYDSGGNTIADASNEYVFVYDITQHTPRQLQALQVSVSAFEGLEWNPNGLDFYVSGGPDDIIHVFHRPNPTAAFTESGTIQLGHNGVGLGLYGITPLAAGLAVTPNAHYLLAANFQNDSVSFIDVSSNSVIEEFDFRPGVINPADAGKPGGSYPYAVVATNTTATSPRSVIAKWSCSTFPAFPASG